MSRRPRILISNDDGVDAPGIWALYVEVSKFADATVVAPITERSAVGHAISVYNQITLRRHIREEKSWGYGIDGTPADCVKMALTTIMKDTPPDLVISGINRGQNTGTSILYSGTVAAALEATMSGLPSIAVSLAVIAPFKGEKLSERELDLQLQSGNARELARKPENYEAAARFSARLCRTVLKRGLPKGILLNVNVPFLPEDKIKGVVISKMGHSVFVDEYQVVNETAGVIAYRNIGDRLIPSQQGEDWDDLVLEQARISITPLHYDLTHHHFLDELRRWMEEEDKITRELNDEIVKDLSSDLKAEVQ
jgi:5'-nucleotidase